MSSNTFVTVLHILVIMSSHGSAVGPLLLQKNIGSTIRQLLVKQKQSGATSTSSLALTGGSEAAATDLVQRNPQVHAVQAFYFDVILALEDSRFAGTLRYF